MMLHIPAVLSKAQVAELRQQLDRSENQKEPAAGFFFCPVSAD